MHSKQGIILCNLGTPLQPTPRGVRNFLAPFLSDQRVVELPRVLWLPLLYGLILPLRSRRVAKAYAAIWTEKGSPLQAMTERQCELLAQLYRDEELSVAFAMTYGKPVLAEVVSDMQQQGIEDIVVLPLYPQYSATTTASLYDQWARYSQTRRNLPGITFIRDYHDHPQYIDALARSVREARGNAHQDSSSATDSQTVSDSRLLLFSFHGIPEVNVQKGDPYLQHCERTAELVSKKLELDDSQWRISFQSRFGKQEWLQPYTSETLKELGAKNRPVDVICPAFAADCLETLEEISQENRQIYMDAGGQQFEYIPCLNDSDAQILLLRALLEESFLALS